MDSYLLGGSTFMDETHDNHDKKNIDLALDVTPTTYQLTRTMMDETTKKRNLFHTLPLHQHKAIDHGQSKIWEQNILELI